MDKLDECTAWTKRIEKFKGLSIDGIKLDGQSVKSNTRFCGVDCAIEWLINVVEEIQPKEDVNQILA